MPGFRECLLDQGFKPHTAVFHLQLMAHVGRWMDREGLELSGLTASAAGRFLAVRRAAGFREVFTTVIAPTRPLTPMP